MFNYAIRLLLPALIITSAAAHGAPPRGSTERELEIGREVTQELDQVVELLEDPESCSKLEGMCAVLAVRTKRPLVHYQVKVFESHAANAFILPGGFIYVTSALLDSVRSDHELAGIMAHEIAHNVNQHSIKRMDRGSTKALRLAELVSMGLLIFTGGGQWGQAAHLGIGALTQSVMSAYSIEDEKEADFDGLRTMLGTEYNPVGFLTFLEREANLRNQFLEDYMGFYRTHPFSGDRVLRARRFLEGEGVPIKRRLVNGAPEPEYGLHLRDGDKTPAVLYEGEPLFLLGDPDSTSPSLVRNLQALDWILDQEVPAGEMRVTELPSGGARLDAGGAVVELTPEDARANGLAPAELAASIRDRLEAYRERARRQTAILYYLIGGMQED